MNRHSSPDGTAVNVEATPGTVTRHRRQHRRGREMSTNPVASMFARTRVVIYRGRFDDTRDVTAFAETLEGVCIQTVEAGNMTRDLEELIKVRMNNRVFPE